MIERLAPGARAGMAVWAALGTLVAMGCGQSGRKPVYPVTGEVFYKGKKPCVGALVVFHPLGTTGLAVDRPHGTVQGNGSFTLSTFGEGDGAPEGEYGVTIVWQRPPKTAASGDLAQRRTGPDLLRGRYADPKNPRLKARVEKRPTTLPRFIVE